MAKKKKGCYFVPQGSLDIKENNNKQINLMVAYVAAVKGGNKKLADDLYKQAKKMGFAIEVGEFFIGS